MRYYELDKAGRRQHDELLKETLKTFLQVFHNHPTPNFTELDVEADVIEQMVCSLAEILSEFIGGFEDPNLNKAVSDILEVVGDYKLALYKDELPPDLPTFPELVDTCIGSLRSVECQATTSQDISQLYELVFSVGAGKDWVTRIVDVNRVEQMQGLLKRHLKKMYADKVLDGYYVRKLVKGIMESTASTTLYSQMETVIGWLSFDEK